MLNNYFEITNSLDFRMNFPGSSFHPYQNKLIKKTTAQQIIKRHISKCFTISLYKNKSGCTK